MKKNILIMLIALSLISCSKKESEHTHDFTKRDISDGFISTPATCTEGTTYFYSCSCGEKGTETFSDNAFAEHVFGEWETLEEGVTESRKCGVCGLTEEAPVEEPSPEASENEEPRAELPEVEESKPIYRVSKIGASSITFEKAECLSFDIKVEATEPTEHSINRIIIPEVDGYYGFEFEGIGEEIQPDFYVVDDTTKKNAFHGERIKDGMGCVIQLSEGAPYNVKFTGLTDCDFTLKIWKQKPVANVSEYTLVYDSFEFDEQNNTYTFKPEISGSYGFGIVDADEDITPAFQLLDSNGENISKDEKVTKGENIFGELTAGETYTITVTSVARGKYVMNIGLQKPTVDISPYSAVTDSLSFDGQKNVYTFTPENSGSCTFTLTNTDSNRHGAGIWIYDSSRKPLAHRDYCIDGDYVTLTDAVAGQEYTVCVQYYMLPTNYTLWIS